MNFEKLYSFLFGLLLAFSVSACSGTFKGTDIEASWACNIMGDCGNE